MQEASRQQHRPDFLFDLCVRAAGFCEEHAGHQSHHEHAGRPLGASRGERARVHRHLGAGRWRRAGSGKTSSVHIS